MFSQKLNILYLEDVEADARLVEYELRKRGAEFSFLRVDNRGDFERALREFSPTVILSDHALPDFDGVAAMAMAGEKCPNVPFIFVTGMIGEESAVELIKNGAADCIMKDRLWRLPSCVAQALERLHEREERRNLQEQFLQSQKMQVFGQLAGGIAHDFNNLLTIINGYAQMHLQQLPAEDPVRETLHQIHQAGERASRLTRQLLAFSRLQVVEPRLIDMNDLLLNMQSMLSRLIGENIEIVLKTEAGLWPVKADPGQIEQVIMNMAVNARDAMSGTGKLLLETQNCRLDADYVRAKSEVKAGDYTGIYVSDTGHGMSREVLERVFEPFFTTKEVGKGTGLGLATCFGIIKQAEGHVEVYSEIGVGTTFKVYLPRYQGPLARREKKEAPARPAVGREKILVVEDDLMVRKFAARILRECGYTVLEAEDGEKALQKISQNEEIALVLTDVVMPKMSGKELSDKIRETASRQPKFLYVSGYSDGIVTLRGVVESNVNFLQKPYSPSALSSKVRQILDS